MTPIDTALVLTPLFSGRTGTISPVQKDSVSPIKATAEADKAAADRQIVAAGEQSLPSDTQPQSVDGLQKAVSDISHYVQNLQRDIQFQIDTELDRTIITVVDSRTHEVVRQIPSEEVLEQARRLKEQSAAGGLLLQVKI